MKVVVGSKNIPKCAAVEASFSRAFPADNIIVEGLATESGVSSHPTSADESIRGALNRATEASLKISDADYYVGIEGGLLTHNDRAWEIGWVAIRNSQGQTTTGLSAGIELRGKVLEAIVNGIELNDVLKNDYGFEAAGSNSGFYGIATNDIVTRQDAYEQGITFALAPFLHPEFYSK